MKILPIIFAVLLAGCQANRAYLDFGVGAHPVRADAPEIGLGNPIGVAGFGYELGEDHSWIVEGAHYSDLNSFEVGQGFNVITVKKRLRALPAR